MELEEKVVNKLVRERERIMRLYELKQIIRECIEESFLVEKTPNQRAHPRKVITRGNYRGYRQNTDYGYDPLDRPDNEVASSGRRKGLTTIAAQNRLKDSIRGRKDTSNSFRVGGGRRGGR